MEYKDTILEVMTSSKLDALKLILFNDSRLVVNHYVGISKVKDEKMRKYLERLQNGFF